MSKTPERFAPVSRRGRFITLEGGDGSGKTSLAAAVSDLLAAHNYTHLLTSEPGGTQFGEQVWRFFTGEAGLSDRLDPLTELFLFAADRAQHVAQVIRPALDAGTHVICSRFADSTIAYQGHGRGLSPDHIRAVNHIATAGLVPELTLLLNVSPEAGLARKRGEAQPDSIGSEELAFHERVQQGFLDLAQREPRRFFVVDASQPADLVVELCWARVQRLLDFIG